MKIFYCCTPSHKILRDEYFLRTMPPGFEPVEISCDFEGRGDFGSREFQSTIARKVDSIISSLEQNQGDYIAWSDVDIVFFRDPIQDMEQRLSRSDISALFAHEWRHGTEVNMGFFVCHSNIEVIGLFKEVWQEMRRSGDWNEQTVTNRILRQRQAGWAHLPTSYYMKSHGGTIPENAFLYHANCTAGWDGVGQKIRQFQSIPSHMFSVGTAPTYGDGKF